MSWCIRALALGLAIVLTAAVPDAGSLRIAMSTEPNSLNPIFGLNDYEGFVDRLIFDVLISSDEKGRLVPRLAREVPSLSNGGISRDGLSITYRLRHGVTWHDGAPFTSRDVKFSFDAIMNPANNVPNRHGYDVVRDVATPSDDTVVFHLKRPYAPVLTQLFGEGIPGGILPAHLLAGNRDLNQNGFNQAPVGTGPFKVVRWNRGDSIELVRNDRYFLGRPGIERLTVRFIPDENTAVNELKTGELDLFTEASVNAYGMMKRVPNLTTAVPDIHGASTLLINNTRPQFRDVRVRRAVAYAIDKRAIVNNYTFGAGTVATEDLPSFMWAYDLNVARYGYDPKKARALLAAAGWRQRGDGLVVKDGKTLDAVLAFAQNNATTRLVSVQLQAYLRAVGLNVQLKGYNSSMMFAGYAAGGVYQSGNFDLAWYTMTLGLDPDSSGRFACDAVPPNGQNYSRYCTSEMDRAQRAGLTHYDLPARKRAYAESQRLLARDVPIVFVFWPKDVNGCTRRLHGFTPNAVTASWNAYQWSLSAP